MAELANRDEFEDRLQRALGKVGSAAQRRILDALGSPPDLSKLTPDLWAEIETAYRGAIAPELESVFIEGAEAAATEVGISFSWDVVNEEAARWANQYTYDLVRGINDRSRRLLQESISGFFEAPMTNAQLREKLGRIWGPRRSEQIAITEITRASAEGQRVAVREIEQSVRESGLVPVAYWVTSEDSRVCSVCGPRDGKRQGDGWTLPPPAHVGCRCAERFVFEPIEATP